MNDESPDKTDVTEEVVINDPIGKAIVQGAPGGLFGRTFGYPYTKKTGRYYAGYGGGLSGKMYSEGDPNAKPLQITEEDLKSWNPLQKFAYRHHIFFFSIGSLLGIAAVTATYYLTNINPYYGIIAFFVFIIPFWYFIQVLFLIEGQSITGKKFKLIPSMRDAVDDEPLIIKQNQR